MLLNMSDTDLELLARYTRQNAEDAFAEIVRRHLDLVHSAALRQVRSPQLAEEVAQSAFIKLAGHAHRLAPDTILTAWLYQVTCREAIDVVRREARRQLREQIATEMNAMNATDPSHPNSMEADTDWTHIEPLLDEAMHALDDTDRAAVLLRYFESKSLREVGATLGTTDDAARKRVNRAVECLREFFAKRGVTIGASGLVVVISANAVQAAPIGLAVTISTATALAGTAIVTTATATATKTIVMTTVQKSLIAATLVAAVGTGIYEARQASQLRGQIQSLQRQQMPLAGQLTQLQTENERLSNQVVQAKGAQALSKAQFDELLKLRGKSGVAQANSTELAKLKATLADQAGKTDQLTNALAIGMEMAVKARMTIAQARLELMKRTLELTEDQVRAIREIMQKHTQRQTEMALEAMSGKMTPEQREATAAQAGNQDDEIKALFTPEQLAAYPQFQHAEKIAAAEKSANYQTSEVADDLSLSREQEEQIREAFYQMNLNEPARGMNHDAIAAARKSGNPAEVINKSLELEKSQLEERLKILGHLLTPEQTNAYREKQMKRINMMAGAMKTLLPQQPAGSAN